jgi:DNA invertase Pin-like site-specific DNA recombinase
MDRPGLQWILERLDTIGEIWTWDTDRLMRHSFFAPYLMHELRTRGIKLWGPWGSDVDTPMGRFMTDIRMRFGAYYREEIGETAKRTRDFRLKEGLWSGHAPTGYRFTFETDEHSRRILVPDPDAAPGVQALFRMMAEGVSQREACRLLGVNPPTFIWQRDNPLYIGLVYKGRGNVDALESRTYDTLWNLARDPEVDWIVPGRHEPLIDQATWDALEHRRRTSSRNRTSARRALSGVFRCSQCHGVLRIRSNHGWPTLRCDRCRWEKSYRQAEATVLAALATVMHSPDFEAAVEAELARPEEVDRSTLDALILERSKVLRQLDRAVDMLVESDDLETDLRRRAVGFKRRKETLDREIAREQARIASTPSVVRAWRDTRALVDLAPMETLWGQATPPEQRQLVRDVFGTVEASPGGCRFALVGLEVAFDLEWCYPHPKEATTGIEPV